MLYIFFHIANHVFKLLINLLIETGSNAFVAIFDVHQWSVIRDLLTRFNQSQKLLHLFFFRIKNDTWPPNLQMNWAKLWIKLSIADGQEASNEVEGKFGVTCRGRAVNNIETVSQCSLYKTVCFQWRKWLLHNFFFTVFDRTHKAKHWLCDWEIAIPGAV